MSMQRFLPRELPAGLENLTQLAFDLRWSAGDHLKTASDLGLPLVGVGLLYQQGYFRQSLDAEGRQLAFYPFNDPVWLPVMPVRDTAGEWLCIELPLPGRSVIARLAGTHRTGEALSPGQQRPEKRPA